MTTEQIGKEFGLSGSTIYRLMKRRNVKVRTRTEQLRDLKILNTGRIFTEEAKINVSIGVKNSYNNIELRKKRSEDNKRIWSNMDEDEKVKRYSTGLRKAQLAAQKANISSIEIKIKEELDILGISYIHQKPICNGKFILDFYLPDYKIVIECNGDYWHKLPDRKKRDKELEKYVKSKGRKIAFIWEYQINNNAKEALLEALKEEI